MKLQPWSTPTGDRSGFNFRCPGCLDVHTVTDAWSVTDAATDTPTISPSVLVRGFQRIRDAEGRWTGEYVYAEGRVAPVPAVCHSFVRAGVIEFLADCTHEMAGTSVGLPDW